MVRKENKAEFTLTLAHKCDLGLYCTVTIDGTIGVIDEVWTSVHTFFRTVMRVTEVMDYHLFRYGGARQLAI